MDIINKTKVIECIARENYDNFCHAIIKTEKLRINKTIVIFGAGILGLQFANTLISLGISDFIFCDNDENKWGRRICNTQVVTPQSIVNRKRDYYVFLAIENYFECAEQLKKSGYKQGDNFYNLTNCSEKKWIEDYKKDLSAEVLVLGDCTATTISMEDQMKQSIKNLIYKENKIKVLAMNGMYMRAFYNVLLMSLNKMEAINKVVMLLNLDIFGNKYHLLSKNQHENVFDEMFKMFEGNDIEINSFMITLKERRKNTSICNYVSPNRDEDLSESKVEQGRRNHLRLNYLYDLIEDNESVRYLDKMLCKCLEYDIEPYFVFMPVNWELGEKYYGKVFYEKYNKVKDIIYNHIIDKRGKVLDLSFFLSLDDFIYLRSTNEGIRETGRRKIAQIIMHELGEVQ